MRTIIYASTLAILATMMICSTGLAAYTWTMNPSPNTQNPELSIKGAITITPSGAVILYKDTQHNTIHAGDTATGYNTLSILSNAQWTLTAKSTTDKMMSGSNSLASYMQVAIGTTPTTWYDISTTLPTVTLASGTSKTGTTPASVQANYRQLFGPNDVGGAYSITVTWTATATYT